MKKRPRALPKAVTIGVLLILLPFFSAPATLADSTVVTPPSKDAWVDETDPSINHGDDTELKVRSEEDSDNSRTLVAFTLPDLPDGAIIESAILSLFMKDAPSGDRTYGVYRITQDWVEGDGSSDNDPSGEVTWDNKPATEASPTSAVSIGTSDNVTKSWDVTTDVQGFYAETFSNYGWMIQDENENTSPAEKSEFRSKEHDEASEQPSLEIVYSVPEGQGAISGFKFNDLNANGVKDENEPGLEGWLINLSGEISASIETDEDGNYSFENLADGEYIVCEELQEGWAQTLPASGEDCDNDTLGYSLTIEDGSAETDKDFGNRQLPGITIIKQTVPDESGEEFDFESDFAGDFTLMDGEAEIADDLDPDEYEVSEDVPEGWIVSVACEGTAEFEIDGASVFIDLGPEENLVCTYTNTDLSEDETPPESSFNISYDHEVITTEIADLDLSGRSTDDLSGVASATLTIQKIGDETTISNFPAQSFFDVFAELSCPAAEPIETEIVALSLVSVDPLTVTWDPTISSEASAGVYCFKVNATDEAGNVEETAVAGPVAFIPLPQISEEATSNVTETSFTVAWTTDHPATSRVVYDTISHPELGEQPNYGYAFSTPETDTDPKVTSHSVTISGLTSGTAYFYRLISHGSPESVSEESSSTTSAAPSQERPTAIGGSSAVIGTFFPTPTPTPTSTPIATPLPTFVPPPQAFSPAPQPIAAAGPGQVSETESPSPEISPEGEEGLSPEESEGQNQLLFAAIGDIFTGKWLILIIILAIVIVLYFVLRKKAMPLK